MECCRLARSIIIAFHRTDLLEIDRVRQSFTRNAFIQVGINSVLKIFWIRAFSNPDRRAICGRVENTLQGLPPPFLLNRPAMYLMTSSETRQPGTKAPNFSAIWTAGDAKPEIINANTGKPESGYSKVCKRALMQKFLKLHGQLSTITQPGSYSKIYLYDDAKKAMHSYNVGLIRSYNLGYFLFMWFF